MSPLDLPATCAAGTIFNINGNPLGTSGSSTAIGNIYALNTATGLNVPIGRFFGPGGPSEGPASSTGLNALAVTPSLSFAYAVTQSATGTRTIYTHARNGTNTTQSAGTAGSGTTVVMGAFDPDNGVYYYAGYSGSGTSRELVIFGYNPALTGSARVLGRVVTVSFSTAGTGGQTFETGDMAFDANGNLFVVAGTNFTAAANTSQIRRVNGPFPTTPQATPQSRPSTTLATNEAGEPGTGFYNGIAFAPDGTLYAQYSTTGTSTLVDLNPNTGNRLFVRPQSGVPSTGILTDLAGCSLPGTLTLEKNLPDGRARSSDQFRMEITGGGITEGNTATTSGSATGVQSQRVGPLPGIPSTEYTISESLTADSGSTLSDYTSTWACRDNNTGQQVANGSGTSGSFSFPAPDEAVEGAVVVCTFTNTPRAPGISIQKSAYPTTFGAAGELITYTYTVTNTGGTTLTDVHVTDNRQSLFEGPITCQATTLEPGESTTCTATYRTTQADVNNNQPITNVARSHGTPPTGPEVSSPPDDATITPTHNPGISIQKSAYPTTFGAAGELITYTYQVVNTGNTTLTDVRVTDDRQSLFEGPITCQATTLEPGESTTCTATYRTTQADVNNNQPITNVARSHGTPPTGPEVSSPPDDATITPTHNPGISIQKSAYPTTFGAAGELITYTYQVVNTGNTTLHDVRVTDDRLTDVSCQLTTLEPGESTTCTATYTTTQADVNNNQPITNVARSHGTPPTGPEVSSPPDDATITPNHNPGISIQKSAYPTTFGAAGELITYTYQVVNTGNTTLTDVRVTDDRQSLFEGPITCQATTLEPGESTTCTATYRTTQADVNNNQPITNVARSHGTPPTGPEVESEPDDATITPNHNPGISIQKSAYPTTFGAAGELITYTYQVTNTGNTTLHDVRVTDDRLTDVSCQLTTLQPGESTTCTATYTTTQADVNNNQPITNVARSHGTPPTGPEVESEPDDATITPNHNPGISIQKSAYPTTFGAAGELITYTYQVVNTGNTTLHDVRVTDDRLTDVSCQLTTLEPGESTTCTATYTTTQADVNNNQPITNVARSHGTPPTGPEVSSPPDDARITPNHNPGIAVDKSASPSTFTGAGEEITYTFVVTNSGNVTLTNISLTDSVMGSITCPHATLDPGEHMTCTATYTTTQADVNNGRVHNTATVTGDPPTGPPVRDTDDETVTVAHAPGITVVKSASPATFSGPGEEITYTFRVTNSGNVTLTNISLTDSVLGQITCPHATLDPGEHMTCTATYTTTQADVNNGRVHNTATVTGDPPTGPPVRDTDEATVELTPVPPTPTPPPTTPTPPPGPQPPGPQPPGPQQPAPRPPAPVPPQPPLAGTGLPAGVLGIMGLAAALIIAGGVVTALGRHRRRSQGLDS